MKADEQRLLKTTFERLAAFERDSVARLTRLEENLRLLRQDLVGDGQPGRIVRLETEVDRLRAEYHRQRGIWAAISFVISVVVALVGRLFSR